MERSQRVSVTGEDGVIVLSLQVPQLPRVSSAPNMTELQSHSQITDNGTIPKSHSENAETSARQEKDRTPQSKETPKEAGDDGEKKAKMQMTKKELAKKYQLHFFVFLIFLATVISVSLSWYYRALSLRMLQSTQTIFFDPRSRLLTLTDPTDSKSIEGHLGLDMPKWQLPLYCPVVVGEDPSSRKCEWKNNAVLSIDHFHNQHVQCYNVSWDSLHPEHVPYDCFNIKDAAWYGPSNQSHSTFPIRGRFHYKPTNQRIDNNGVFSYVEDFYWLSSTGVALRIHGDDPIHLFWNETGEGTLCLLSNHTGPLYHQGHRSQLHYTICNGLDPYRTHAFMQESFPASSKITFPSDKVFRGNFWSLKGTSTSNGVVSQNNVIDFARELKTHSHSDAKIVMDTAWQAFQGDMTFDPELFPNITQMASALEDLDVHMTMVLSPIIHHASPSFREGMDSSRFVLDCSGDVAGLVKTPGGVSAVLDIFNVRSRKWYRQQMQTLLHQLPMASLRLTYGQGPWIPYKPHFDSHAPEATPRVHRTQMTETMSRPSQPLIVEHTSNTRHLSHLIPVHARISQSEDGKMCMGGVIESALTLGLMGYPFVLLDGLDMDSSVSNQRNNSEEDIELTIRWFQLAAFFPASQISTPPWMLTPEVVSTATNYSHVHESRVIPLLKDEKLRRQVAEGLPILRPVWWLDSDNNTVHDMQITDEFLLGDYFLVAPVLCTGRRSRDVFIPPGVWEDGQGKIFLGPKTVTSYAVPLHHIAVFHRLEVQG